MFQKGKEKTGGRQKGTLNKKNEQLRTLIGNFLQENFEEVQKEFATLSNKDKVKAYTELLPYALPKMQSVETTINYDDMSDEQITELLNRIMQNHD